jgi:hypothetical protein
LLIDAIPDLADAIDIRVGGGAADIVVTYKMADIVTRRQWV